LAEQALEHAAPDLAARVIELEAENKRLREGLDLASHRLNAAAVFAGSHAPNREMYEFGEWFKEARTALKGGGDMSEVYQHQSATLTGVGWPVAPQPEVLDVAALTALSRNYERRILDLEKQVAELRALLKERE
jgi:uncharacterized protein YceH (UPF0502 family)